MLENGREEHFPFCEVFFLFINFHDFTTNSNKNTNISSSVVCCKKRNNVEEATIDRVTRFKHPFLGSVPEIKGTKYLYDY